jgi:hypothetical protein
MLIIFIHGVGLGASLLVERVHCRENDFFRVSMNDGERSPGREDFFKELEFGSLGPIWRREHNVKGHKESAFIKGPLVDGHAFSRNGLGVTGLDDFARENVDNERALIEMLNNELAPGKGREKLNRGLVVEIRSLSLESWVRLLLNDNNNVARLDPWGLVSISGKGNLLSLLHALVNKDFQNLFILRSGAC